MADHSRSNWCAVYPHRSQGFTEGIIIQHACFDNRVGVRNPHASSIVNCYIPYPQLLILGSHPGTLHSPSACPMNSIKRQQNTIGICADFAIKETYNIYILSSLKNQRFQKSKVQDEI